MYNSHGNKDLELFLLLDGVSLFTFIFLLLYYIQLYWYLLLHSPLHPHLSALMDHFALPFTKFYFVYFRLFFFSLSRLIWNLNLFFRVLTHFSVSCHLQIYMHFQLNNSPLKTYSASYACLEDCRRGQLHSTGIPAKQAYLWQGKSLYILKEVKTPKH